MNRHVSELFYMICQASPILSRLEIVEIIQVMENISEFSLCSMNSPFNLGKEEKKINMTILAMIYIDTTGTN